MSDSFIQENSEIIMLRAMTNVFVNEGMDPVGKEDGDVDNDGDKDSSDKYLLKRRKAIGDAIKRKKKVVESVVATTDEDEKEVTEKKVKNKVTINPEMKEEVEVVDEARRSGESPKEYAARVTSKYKGKKVKLFKDYDPMKDPNFDHDKAERTRGSMKEGYDKPDEKLKTDRDMFNVPKDEQKAARQRVLAKALAKRKEKGIKEASWDKYGRPKTKESRAAAARAQAEIHAKDKASGRRPYGSKMGYAKKDWDE